MFKFLKNIFKPEPPKKEEMDISQLDGWLQREVSSLDFSSHLKEYYRQIANTKSELKDKIEVLRKKEISQQDKQQVEGRVQNIVVGHKENYAKAIERFAENISPLKKESFSTIDDYHQAIQFNEALDKDIEELAKRTAKSYQAAQHLFFEPVEALFKQMGELNILVKDFRKVAEERKLTKMKEIQELTERLVEDKRGKKRLQASIKEKEERIGKLQQQQQQTEQQLNKLKMSKDYQQYKELKMKREALKKHKQTINDEIFSFFSKLSKPLKKYVRVALDDKPIHPYLDNSLKAFGRDDELKIVVALQGLKKCLAGGTLQFNEKQKSKFLDLIGKSEEGYLAELAERKKKLQSDEKALYEKINQNTITAEIVKVEQTISNMSNKDVQLGKELSELQTKLQKDNSIDVKNQITGLIKEVFNVEMTL